MNGTVLESVTKSYGGRNVLNGISHVFPTGSVTAVTGASGSGKTTLLRILANLEQPDAGSVSGRPERIAFVFQEDRLSEDFNAVSNAALAAPKGVSRKDVMRELASVGIDAFNKPVREFSGGMKRRVAIVRAMLAPAGLVLLDEPFKGLDAETRRLVIAYVRAKSAGKTLVFVTHDPEEIALMGADVLSL